VQAMASLVPEICQAAKRQTAPDHLLVTGMLAPFDRAIREFNAHEKAISRFWQTINHSSYLRKFSR